MKFPFKKPFEGEKPRPNMCETLKEQAQQEKIRLIILVWAVSKLIDIVAKLSPISKAIEYILDFNKSPPMPPDAEEEFTSSESQPESTSQEKDSQKSPEEDETDDNSPENQAIEEEDNKNKPRVWKEFIAKLKIAYGPLLRILEFFTDKNDYDRLRLINQLKEIYKKTKQEPNPNTQGLSTNSVLQLINQIIKKPTGLDQIPHESQNQTLGNITLENINEFRTNNPGFDSWLAHILGEVWRRFASELLAYTDTLGEFRNRTHMTILDISGMSGINLESINQCVLEVAKNSVSPMPLSPLGELQYNPFRLNVTGSSIRDVHTIKPSVLTIQSPDEITNTQQADLQNRSIVIVDVKEYPKNGFDPVHLAFNVYQKGFRGAGIFVIGPDSKIYAIWNHAIIDGGPALNYSALLYKRLKEIENSTNSAEPASQNEIPQDKQIAQSDYSERQKNVEQKSIEITPYNFEIPNDLWNQCKQLWDSLNRELEAKTKKEFSPNQFNIIVMAIIMLALHQLYTEKALQFLFPESNSQSDTSKGQPSPGSSLYRQALEKTLQKIIHRPIPFMIAPQRNPFPVPLEEAQTSLSAKQMLQMIKDGELAKLKQSLSKATREQAHNLTAPSNIVLTKLTQLPPGFFERLISTLIVDSAQHSQGINNLKRILRTLGDESGIFNMILETMLLVSGIGHISTPQITNIESQDQREEISNRIQTIGALILSQLISLMVQPNSKNPPIISVNAALMSRKEAQLLMTLLFEKMKKIVIDLKSKDTT